MGQKKFRFLERKAYAKKCSFLSSNKVHTFFLNEIKNFFKKKFLQSLDGDKLNDLIINSKNKVKHKKTENK